MLCHDLVVWVMLEWLLYDYCGEPNKHVTLQSTEEVRALQTGFRSLRDWKEWQNGEYSESRSRETKICLNNWRVLPDVVQPIGPDLLYRPGNQHVFFVCKESALGFSSLQVTPEELWFIEFVRKKIVNKYGPSGITFSSSWKAVTQVCVYFVTWLQE